MFCPVIFWLPSVVVIGQRNIGGEDHIPSDHHLWGQRILMLREESDSSGEVPRKDSRLGNLRVQSLLLTPHPLSLPV
jgi:hypothetical protein